MKKPIRFTPDSRRRAAKPRKGKAVALSLSLALISAVGLSAAPSAIRALGEACPGDSDSGLMDGYPLSTSGATSYSSFLKHYFDNLTENFGMNYAGSCGYVAMAMMLSYYDAFYDSSIVPSAYDIASSGTESNLIDRACSPGVLHDDFEATGYSSVYGDSFPGASNYLTYAYAISSYSLHAKLITIADTLGYYSLTNLAEPAISTAEHRSDVLSYYLENVVGLSSNEYSIAFGEYHGSYTPPLTENYLNVILSEISNGRPTVVGLRNKNGGGHAVIAYDYNPSTSTLYFHPGVSHSGFTTHMSLDDLDYSFVRSYMTLTLNLSNPSPGSNYIVERGSDSYDYAYSSSMVDWSSTHTHSYYTNFISVSSSSHRAYCSCGDWKLEEHRTLDFHLVNGHLVGTCDRCGAPMGN